MSSNPDLQPINPDALGPPRGYSNGMLAPVGARCLFVAGQIGWDAQQQLVLGGFVPQFEQALRNVVAVVRSAGGEPESIARLTLYVTDLEGYRAEQKALGAAYRAVMGRHYPAMALLQVRGLLEPGALVEITADAVVPPRGDMRQETLPELPGGPRR